MQHWVSSAPEEQVVSTKVFPNKNKNKIVVALSGLRSNIINIIWRANPADAKFIASGINKTEDPKPEILSPG